MIALVTGASKGLGKEFAIDLARRGYDLVITSRTESLLNELKDKIQKENPSIKVKIIPADLLKKEGLKKIVDFIDSTYLDLVINNAGIGVYGEYMKEDPLKEDELISLNLTAFNKIMKHSLKRMTMKNSGVLINISSMAAFSPVPLLAMYSALKSYALSISVAVNTELQKTKSNVRVVAICPPAMDTAFFKTEHMNKGQHLAKRAEEPKIWCGQALERALFKKSPVVLVGGKSKWLKFLSRFSSIQGTSAIIYKQMSKGRDIKKGNVEIVKK